MPVGDVIVPPASLVPLTPGSSLGVRYEIIRLLGQGGMGAVYLAHDRELDRKVALKVILADMAANPESLRRFKQELILARQITHRNVIRIFDLARAENIEFITVDYVEGEDLHSVLRQFSGAWLWRLLSENQPAALPFDPFYSRHEIEMMITANDGQRMLSAKCCDPDVIGWNRRSRSLEFGTDGSIGDSGSVFDVKDTKIGQVLL